MTLTNLLGRLGIFAGLLAAYIAFCVQGHLLVGLGRPLVLFIVGAVLAVFVQGPEYGKLQPISTRPVMIVLGVLLMICPFVWLLAARGALGQ